MPLGGVDEIGSNMTLIKGPQEDIIIDCGFLFPYEESFDINYLIPNLSSLDPARTKSIIITHGHEDHIGGLSHLLELIPHLTVYVTPFTHQLIEKKLAEKKIRFQYQIYRPDQEIAFADVNITPIQVNHSIPETNGLIIRTKNLSWGALYISDFKVDLKSQHEAPMNLKLISDLLRPCHKTVFFIDSTNVISDGKTPSENELQHDLAEIIQRPEKRIFLTLFASNIHRLNKIVELANANDRKVIILGRSLRTYLEAARESGHTEINLEDLYTPEQAKNLNSKVLVLLSGCQGDFHSALRRFSFGEDPHFKPTYGDLVVFSSKVIPGNEKKIYRIYNKLTQFGADVITASDYLIHASGHPGKADLKLLLEAFRPHFYFPIHGESYMLKKHQEFILANFPEVKVNVFHNYQEAILSDEEILINHHPVMEPILIHGLGLEIERSQISQRRKLATQGAVFISYNRKNNGLEISTLGLPILVESRLEQLKKNLSQMLLGDLQHRAESYIKDQLKISTRQYFNHFLGYKPVTEVHLN
jgi:ribonuclease J